MPPPPAPRCSAWQRQLRLLGHRVRLAGRRDAVRGPALAALFRGVNAWLRAVGTDHWLAYGTLLGWHREKAILPHDTDVDFGAPLAAYEILRYAGGRLPPGFVLRDSSHRHHGPKLYVTHAGWEADLYFYAESDGRLRSTERSRNPGETEPFPRALVFPLAAGTLLGEAVSLPAQPEALLRHHYGYLGPDAVRDPVTRYFRPRHPAGPAAQTEGTHR